MAGNVAEVGQKLVELCSQGKFEDAMVATYSGDIVSVEPMAMGNQPAEIRGIEAVKQKGAWWMANHDVHSAKVSGPFVHGDKFIVNFDMDITQKATGNRMQMSEAGVYTVKDGKVVREEFYYATPAK